MSFIHEIKSTGPGIGPWGTTSVVSLTSEGTILTDELLSVFKVTVLPLHVRLTVSDIC